MLFSSGLTMAKFVDCIKSVGNRIERCAFCLSLACNIYRGTLDIIFSLASTCHCSCMLNGLRVPRGTRPQIIMLSCHLLGTWYRFLLLVAQSFVPAETNFQFDSERSCTFRRTSAWLWNTSGFDGLCCLWLQRCFALSC